MNISEHPVHKIGKIFLGFWFLPLILTVINLFSQQLLGKNHTSPTENEIAFMTILIRNFTVFLAIFLVGYVHRTIPYVIYFYNSLIFSFYLSVSLEKYGMAHSLLKVLPHGIPEIISFAMITYIGTIIKSKGFTTYTKYLFVYGVVILLFAAIIEKFVTSNL